MKTLIRLWIAVALTTTAAHAQKAEKPLPVLAEQDRQVPGGRVVQQILRQTEIYTSVETGRIAPAGYADSLIGALIMNDINDDIRDTTRSSLSSKAEAVALPLREALRDFDVDALALSTTRAAVARPEWFQARDVLATKDPMPGNTTLLASSDAAQFAFIRYRYELSPDFSQIRVIALITLERRQAGTATPPPIYRQRITSVVQLRTRSYEPMENVAQWSAANGKLARAALTAAFGQVEQIFPYALGLKQADLATLGAKSHEKAFAAGFYGPLIAWNGPEDLLIWSNGLIHVQTVP